MEINLKTTKLKNINCYKFTETDATNPFKDDETSVYEFLKSKYNKNFSFGIENIKRHGVYKLLGWCLDLRPYLKKFYVKQYDHIEDVYARTKTDIYKSTFGKIQNIVEVE